MSRAVANTLLPAKRPRFDNCATQTARTTCDEPYLRHSILLFAESELLRDRTCCRKYCTARNYDSASCRTTGSPETDVLFPVFRPTTRKPRFFEIPDLD